MGWHSGAGRRGDGGLAALGPGAGRLHGPLSGTRRLGATVESACPGHRRSFQWDQCKHGWKRGELTEPLAWEAELVAATSEAFNGARPASRVESLRSVWRR